MREFNPSEPAILHNQLSGAIIPWNAEDAEVFRSQAVEREDGTIAWQGYVFDGWGNVLGG